MKKTKSLKYDSVPDEVEQSAIAEDQFCEICHFYCIIRVPENAEKQICRYKSRY